MGKSAKLSLITLLLINKPRSLTQQEPLNSHIPKILCEGKEITETPIPLL